MIHNIQITVTPAEAADMAAVTRIAARQSGISESRIALAQIVKRSIDARQRQVKINLTVRLHVDAIDESATRPVIVDYRPVADDAPSAVVVGAGPAGLFAALRLIESGIRPIVLERGQDVDSRRRDLALISREGTVNPDSNYCFGEGGAGAFSDGKLYTRSKKRGPVDKILNILVQHGATPQILVDAHPHIGTDRLPGVIKAMRETIKRCGGQVHFATRVTAINLDADGTRVTGVTTAGGDVYNGPVILATGHSARDIYHALHDSNIAIEPKGIAVGVRLEHPQALIDRIQYHSPQGRGKYLPAAEYSMLTRVDGRAVYSFCMCPGGVIIPAAGAPGELVVNGMSSSSRGGRWANSGMVVEVLPEDVPGTHPLRMMHYQQDIEQRFFADGDGSQNAPAQRMLDFVQRQRSANLPASSYAPGIHSAELDNLLPEGIARRLRQGFVDFGRKSRGFLTNDATMIGCETRTSAPVRIPRDAQTLSHLDHPQLYPCGEGAGYAGGIVSAAIDGDRCAAALAASILQ
jgi:uncharacterized FAD-dependent dehydrogenase